MFLFFSFYDSFIRVLLYRKRENARQLDLSHPLVHHSISNYNQIIHSSLWCMSGSEQMGNIKYGEENYIGSKLESALPFLWNVINFSVLEIKFYAQNQSLIRLPRFQ